MSESEKSLSHDKLLEILSYDGGTGLFTWKTSNSNRRRVGDVAGGNVSKGYIAICIDYNRFFAHRLAWFYVHGVWPQHEVDHINGIHNDNRISNIRATTVEQNRRNKRMSKNNTSGWKGVSRSRKKWVAQIGVDNKHLHLGVFDTVEEAHQAYVAASKKYHGEFGRIS